MIHFIMKYISNIFCEVDDDDNSIDFVSDSVVSTMYILLRSLMISRITTITENSPHLTCEKNQTDRIRFGWLAVFCFLWIVITNGVKLMISWAKKKRDCATGFFILHSDLIYLTISTFCWILNFHQYWKRLLKKSIQQQKVYPGHGILEFISANGYANIYASYSSKNEKFDKYFYQ